jgi:hypothetical protein
MTRSARVGTLHSGGILTDHATATTTAPTIPSTKEASALARRTRRPIASNPKPKNRAQSYPAPSVLPDKVKSRTPCWLVRPLRLSPHFSGAVQ